MATRFKQRLRPSPLTRPLRSPSTSSHSPNVRGTVRAGTDLLPADNVFNFVLTPSDAVSLLIVDNVDRPESSLYLSKALSIGTTPTFQVEVVPVSRVTPESLKNRLVAVINATMFPPAWAGGVLKKFVERGGGLLIVAGERTTWPTADADLLPGKLGAEVDRTSGRGGALGFLDYSHPVFEVFKAPRSGDFSAAHVFRYRALEAGPADRVLARFDDGAIAAAERRVGAGRVIVWTTTLDDSWTDMGVKPVFLPLVHQLIKHLSHFEAPPAWLTVGQVVDLSTRGKNSADAKTADRVVVTPSGERLSKSGAASGADSLLELNEQGMYELRASNASNGRPEAIAVNLDPAESDLAPLDPKELVAMVTGHATANAAQQAAPVEMTREEAEKRQGLWWYFLLAGLLLLAGETIISNRLSQREKFL
jgi:hypothetical protein